MRASLRRLGIVAACALCLALVSPATAWAEDDAAGGADAADTEASADAGDAAEAESTGKAADDPLVNEPSTPVAKRKSREYSTGAKIYDALVLRPFDFVGLGVSSVAFVPAAIFCAPSGRYEVETAYDIMVAEPAENVFERPLGRF